MLSVHSFLSQNILTLRLHFLFLLSVFLFLCFPASDSFLRVLLFSWFFSICVAATVHISISPSTSRSARLFYVLMSLLLPLHLLPLLPPPVTRQRRDEGGGDPEEPERPAAGAGLAVGPQPPVLAAPAGAEPQPPGGVDLPQRGLLPGQSALQLSVSLRGSHLGLCVCVRSADRK